MVKEKRILSYFMGWLLVGFLVCFLGITNVFAETYTPTEIKSQIRTIYTDGTTQWFTSASNNYTTPLYFGAGPSYSTYGIPCNFRLLVVNNIDTQYSYKYSYDMHIFTPYSTSNTWDSSKIDSQYDLKVLDDSGIVKESKCSVISTEKNTNAEGTFMNKSISCVFTVNKNYTNAYISAGYFCKGDCTLSNMEKLGYIPQDSRMSIDNVKIERFNDNSNIIIDQNQTIIDQNNETNEELGNIKEQIEESNKNTQETIKDQFNNCYNNLFKGQFVQSNLTGQVVDSRLLAADNYYIEAGKTYTFSTNVIDKGITFGINISTVKHPTSTDYRIYDSGWQRVSSYTFTTDVDGYFALVLAKNNLTDKISPEDINGSWFMLNEGTTAKPYTPYGEEKCTNRIDETNNKLDKAEETRKGIWQTIKDLPGMFLDMLLGLFIPKDLSFINEFKDVISNKLGFIASVPIQIIDFALGLADVAFNEITTISFPSVDIFGVHFWNAEEIDITILLEKLKPFKYFTDFTCVILCCRTLYDMYHNFTGGGAD